MELEQVREISAAEPMNIWITQRPCDASFGVEATAVTLYIPASSNIFLVLESVFCFVVDSISQVSLALRLDLDFTIHYVRKHLPQVLGIPLKMAAQFVECRNSKNCPLPWNQQLVHPTMSRLGGWLISEVMWRCPRTLTHLQPCLALPLRTQRAKWKRVVDTWGRIIFVGVGKLKAKLKVLHCSCFPKI